MQAESLPLICVVRHDPPRLSAFGSCRGLSSGLLQTSIWWSKLDRMKVSYFSTRRDGRGGWMQLELRAGWSSLRVDSRIEGFSELVVAAAKAAEMRCLSLDPAT